MQNYKVPFKEKSLSATTLGNSANTPIVLVHGNSMSSKIWQHQFQKSLSDKYFLISFDLPGHGDSDNLDTYGLAILAESVTTIIEYFKLSNYIVAGNSLGGDLILQLSQKLNRCKGIMLINTPPMSKPPVIDKALLPNPLIGMFFAKDYEQTNLEQFLNIFLSDTKNTPAFIRSDFERTDGTMRQSLSESINMHKYLDEVEAIKALTMPVVIVAGKNEKMVNNDYYASINIRMLWQQKVQLIEGSAHCPQWEKPEVFNKILDDFCTGI